MICFLMGWMIEGRGILCTNSSLLKILCGVSVKEGCTTTAAAGQMNANGDGGTNLQ